MPAFWHPRCAETLIVYSPVAGGEVSRIDPSATGLNPAWRKANVHVIAATAWAEGANSDTISGLLQELKGDTAKLRALAPESGAYFNEVRTMAPWFLPRLCPRVCGGLRADD